MKRPFIRKYLSFAGKLGAAGTLILHLSCSALTGGQGGNFGGPVGGGPQQFASGPEETGGGGSNSPQMPELPVSPLLDVEEGKQLETRLVAEVLGECQDTADKKEQKEIKAWVQCRWKDTHTPFQTCGRGRYFRIFNSITHEYVAVQASETDASFVFKFTFKNGEASASGFRRSHRLLLALQTQDGGSSSSSSSSGYSGVTATDASSGKEDEIPFQPPPDGPADLPDIYPDAGCSEADKDNAPDLVQQASGLTDLRALLGFSPETDLGVQKFCPNDKQCFGCGVHIRYLNYGPLQFSDPSPDFPTQECSL